MSKLTKSNRKELVILRYFMPDMFAEIPITDEDIAIYFDWADRGKDAEAVKNRVTDEGRTKRPTGLSALYWGKQRRDLQITSYKEDWGTTLTAVDFMEEPRELVEFIAKAIGKPAVFTMWKLKNAEEELTPEDMKLLEPLAKLGGLKIK